MQPEEHTLFHSGDLGDILYALPILKSVKGGAHIRLGPRPNMTRELMTPERYALLAPLLEAQSYILSHAYAPEPLSGWGDGNAWRMTYRGRGQTLAAEQALAFGLHPAVTFAPWLTAPEPKEVAPVVLAKSRRYHNPKFPWRDIVDAYRKEAIFIGTIEEFTLLVKNFGPDANLAYWPTKNFGEILNVLAGAKLFIGNQSAPYAVAEGLKMRTIQETCPRAPDCIFPRSNATYCIGSDLELPNI